MQSNCNIVKHCKSILYMESIYCHIYMQKNKVVKKNKVLQTKMKVLRQNNVLFVKLKLKLDWNAK